ncbi:MAG: SIR2 family protein, partial [Proteobacteria bacterium]
MPHCPYRYTQMLQHALAPGKMRVAFLFGAGCPMAIRVPDGKKTKPLIPDIQVLTQMVNQEIGDKKKPLACAPALERVIQQFETTDNPTVEHILTHIRLLMDVIKRKELGGLSRSALQELDRTICAIITRCVSAQIPDDQPFSPYHQFARWVSAIPREHPLEIFTTNYDLLIEHALEDQKVPYFDGFIGSNRAFFDLPSIEHDRLPSRWARLWKLHGSINWWKTQSGYIERRSAVDAVEQQMIYPSHLKYDQSRRLPYLAMLDRLKAFLAPGKGPAVLVTCGFSFADQHLNELILQSLRGNPSAVCYNLLYGDKEDHAYGDARTCARQQPNIRLLARNGAIVGTVEGFWRSEPQDDHPLKSFISHAVPSNEGET